MSWQGSSTAGGFVSFDHRTGMIVTGMRLCAWAEREGVHDQTAWRWVRAGKMPVPVSKTPPGTILVHADEHEPGGVGRYARVSSHDQRDDLDRQIVRLTRWAADQALPAERVEAEIGSGTNGQRRKVRRLLADAGGGLEPEHLDVADCGKASRWTFEIKVVDFPPIWSVPGPVSRARRRPSAWPVGGGVATRTAGRPAHLLVVAGAGHEGGGHRRVGPGEAGPGGGRSGVEDREVAARRW